MNRLNCSTINWNDYINSNANISKNKGRIDLNTELYTQFDIQNKINDIKEMNDKKITLSEIWDITKDISKGITRAGIDIGTFMALNSLGPIAPFFKNDIDRVINPILDKIVGRP
jgi:hypothetical protein